MKATLDRSELPEGIARLINANIPGTDKTHEKWLVEAFEKQGIELSFVNEFPWSTNAGNQYAHRLQGGE